jgi:hypothetical protein
LIAIHNEIPQSAKRAIGVRRHRKGPNALMKYFRRLANWWFRPRAFEQSGACYRFLGVPIFKKMLMVIVGGRKSRLSYGLEGRGMQSVENFERWTRIFEVYHLILGAFITAIVIKLFLGSHHISLELVIAGSILNLYLVLLQRYNRARIRRAIDRMMGKCSKR